MGITDKNTSSARSGAGGEDRTTIPGRRSGPDTLPGSAIGLVDNSLRSESTQARDGRDGTHGPSGHGHGGGHGHNTLPGGVADTIIGGDGNDTIDGGIAASVYIQGGSGSNTLISGTGSDTIQGGSGSNTIDAGKGHVLITDDENVAISYDTVTGFDHAAHHDRISFTGENPHMIHEVVASAKVSGGNTTITLPDGSTMTFIGISHINPSFFQ